MMNEWVLAKYDVSGIQSYIFASNRLRENTGASVNVGSILKCILPDVINKWSKKRNGKVIINWKEVSGEKFQMPDDEDILAEVLYIGGGNAFVVYREIAFYHQINRDFAIEILKKCQGVAVFTSAVNVSPDHFPQDQNLLNRKIAEQKDRERRYRPVSSYAIVEQDSMDGCPVTNQMKRNGVPVNLSQLRYERYRASDQPACGQLDADEYAIEMEDLAEQKGENSYVAVIHIDGNSMGEMIQSIFSKHHTYQEAVPAMRRFSKEIEDRNRRAEDTMVSTFKRAFERHPLPFRPLIMDGDDMTFICCGKAGIAASVLFLRSLMRQKGKLSMSACAGIAFVHNHFPFRIAYNIAEKCCSRAKKCWYEKGKCNNAGYLDFEVVKGTYTEEMSGGERETELRARPYRVAVERLNEEPESIDFLYEILKKLKADEKDGEAWPVNRLRRLYEAYLAGKVESELLKQENASRGYRITDVTGGREKQEIFDALETMDFYDYAVWTAFWDKAKEDEE